VSSAQKGTRATLRQTEQPGILRDCSNYAKSCPELKGLTGVWVRWVLSYLEVQKSGEVFQTKEISGENSGESCLRVSDGICHISAESRPKPLSVFARGDECLDHLGGDEVAVELIQLR